MIGKRCCLLQAFFAEFSLCIGNFRAIENGA